MIRLLLLGIALGVFADMFRRAWSVHADSLLLPIAGVVLLLLVAVIRTWRRELRRWRRKRTGFLRPGRPRWDDTH